VAWLLVLPRHRNTHDARILYGIITFNSLQKWKAYNTYRRRGVRPMADYVSPIVAMRSPSRRVAGTTPCGKPAADICSNRASFLPRPILAG
jgi:hypothetical protein